MATKRNARSLELIHEWSTAQKAAYNREYYRKNKDYWTRYYAQKLHELDDNRDRLQRSTVRNLSLNDDLRNLKAAQWNYEQRYGKTQDYAKNGNPWDKEVKEYERKVNATEGDTARYLALQKIHSKSQGSYSNAPQATMKPQSKAQLAVNHIKRSATKAAKVVGSKAHSAGKAFIDNWKAGWG